MREANTLTVRKKLKPAPFILLALTVFLTAVFLAPVFFAVISAFKSNGEILKNPMSLPTSIYLKNFQDLFAQSDFVTAIKHSVFLTVVSEILIVCIVPLAAYAMERRQTRVTKVIYAYFLAGMMIPFHLYMFPLFKEMKLFGIFGTLAGPVTCYISGSVAFGSLLYCSFLKGVPLEIEEAAEIDGCNPFQTFWQVTFPLLGPCTASMVGNILPFHKSRTGLQNPKDETVFNKRMGFDALDKNSKKFKLIPTHRNDYFPMHNELVFTVARNYFDLTGMVGDYNYVGTLFLDVDVSRIEEAFRNISLNPEDRVYVCDKDYNCYYSSDRDLIGMNLSSDSSIFKETDKEFLIETDYNSYGVNVIITMNTDKAYQKLRKMQHMMYLFLGVTFAALLSGSIWFSKRLTKPIYHMMDRMSEIETGNFKVELPVTSEDEIGILSHRFNQMSKELENYINQSYVAHMKQTEAEMTALKSQIYPHFLYNTLEVIRMTALEKDDYVVSEMIEALSTQIRYMIGPMQDMVSLEQEVDIIRKYVYLLNCRITGKVKLAVNLSGFGKQRVPKLILQPIVENAFVHGIKPRDGSGNVLISAEQNDHRLEISVMDNGVGMDEAALMRLRELLAGNEPGIKNEHNWQSIGLKNVHDRIRYLFGEGYGIEVTSTLSVGTMVRIIMPWKKGDEEDVSNDSGR